MRRCPPLDVNSAYAYSLLGFSFRETCVVAEDSSNLVGLCSGYRQPDDPETLFVWQVAVDASARGHGLGGRMLEQAFSGSGCRRIQTTISPSNTASRRLFRRFAESRGMVLRETTFLPAYQTEAGLHEEENLISLTPGRDA